MSGPFRDYPEQWPPDSLECVFLGRALSRLSDDDAWTALRSGELEARVYCVGRSDFAPVPLSPLILSAMDRDSVFSNCQIAIRDKDIRRPAAVRRVIPVPHWLYVTRASVDRFMMNDSATAGAENRAVQHLAILLRAEKDLTKASARKACQQFHLSGQGFEDRVWPKARERAGLPPRARAGRKSRS